MYKKIAAFAAALLILSACSAKTASVQTLPASDTSTLGAYAPVGQASQNEITTVPSVEEQKPVVDALPVSESFLDEPYAYQADVEEVVSISLTLPKITLDSQEASDRINAVFEKLQANLCDFATTTVYETAQETNSMGFLEGSYTAELNDGILSVSYSLVERYSSGEGTVTHENVYRFDAATGEQLDA